MVYLLSNDAANIARDKVQKVVWREIRVTSESSRENIWAPIYHFTSQHITTLSLVIRESDLYTCCSSMITFYCSTASTIFSLSFAVFIKPFLVCFLSFSARRLRALISSALISLAFFTCLGRCLCLRIRRISGICLYLSLRASSYSSFCRSRADLMPSRREALARQSLTFPSSDPDKIY